MISSQFLDDFMQELQWLPEDQCITSIESTRKELESYHYSPTLTVDVPNFLSATKSDIVAFINGLIASRGNTLNREDLSLIMYHYRLLQKLRCDDPESWNQVMEMLDED